MNKNFVFKVMITGGLLFGSIQAEYIVYKDTGGACVAPTEQEYAQAYRIIQMYQFPRYVYARTAEMSLTEKAVLDRDEEAFLTQKIQQTAGPEFRLFFVAPTVYDLLLFVAFLNPASIEMTLRAVLSADSEAGAIAVVRAAAERVQVTDREQMEQACHHSPALPSVNDLRKEGQLKGVGRATDGVLFGCVLAGLLATYDADNVSDARCRLAETVNRVLVSCRGIFLADQCGVAQRLVSCVEQSGVCWVDDFARPAARDLITRAVALEQAHRDCALLYRGSDTRLEEELTRESDKLSSLSFGRTLLAAWLTDNDAHQVGASALGYMLDCQFGYALRLNRAQYRAEYEQRENMIFLPPSSAITNFFGWGEWFHPRGKLAHFKGARPAREQLTGSGDICGMCGGEDEAFFYRTSFAGPEYWGRMARLRPCAILLKDFKIESPVEGLHDDTVMYAGGTADAAYGLLDWQDDPTDGVGSRGFNLGLE